MKIWARYHPTAAHLAPHEPALLLEGSWPGSFDLSARWSLDRTIDARSAWIDGAAAELAEGAIAATANGLRRAEIAWLNVVKLRYALVKLLRVVAFFRELRPLAAGQRVELFLGDQSDEPYAVLFAELCAASNCELQVTWLVKDLPQPSPLAPDNRWRRGLAWANTWAERGHRAVNAHPRVVLCGNPRILNPVGTELVRRGHRCWWLYERFAVGSWLRWTGRGIGQIVVGNLPAPVAERAAKQIVEHETGESEDRKADFAGSQA